MKKRRLIGHRENVRVENAPNPLLFLGITYPIVSKARVEVGMAKVISIFNNKGGVGKSTICWNLADALGRADKKVLLIDFDPQCNLSIAMLGDKTFVGILPSKTHLTEPPYGRFFKGFSRTLGAKKSFSIRASTQARTCA